MNIELEITLKCNAHCRNCNKFCNMEDLGLIYGDEWDLSLEDIDKFIEQVKDIGNVQKLRIMGGEPTLHPLYEEICKRIKENLIDTGIVQDVCVVTNGLLKKECCIRTLIQLPIEYKEKRHTCTLVSPLDMGISLKGGCCTTPKIFGVSYNKLGWFPCGPGGAIARLFGLDHIKKNTITAEYEWVDLMDVCKHCINKATSQIFERDKGRPISESYQVAINNYVSRQK